MDTGFMGPRHGERVDLDLLLSVSSGLGVMNEDADGKHIYVVEPDCLGGCSCEKVFSVFSVSVLDSLSLASAATTEGPTPAACLAFNALKKASRFQNSAWVAPLAMFTLVICAFR